MVIAAAAAAAVVKRKTKPRQENTKNYKDNPIKKEKEREPSTKTKADFGPFVFPSLSLSFFLPCSHPIIVAASPACSL